MKRIQIYIFLICLLPVSVGFNCSGTDDTLTILFTGDIMLGRQVGKMIIRQNDPSFPFRDIHTELSGADVTIGNLECVFADTIITGTYYHKTIILPAYRGTIEGLTLSGFDMLSIANNHSMDFGTTGLHSTVRLLKENKIESLGIDSHNPLIKTVKGFNLQIFSYWMNNDSLFDVSMSNGYTYVPEDTLIKKIQNANMDNDIVILFIHWGREYTAYPTDSQEKFAHRMIDSGADIVAGHGPHQVQKVEKYRDGVIAYSLGNLVFDQKYEETKKGYLLHTYFWKKQGLTGYEVIPVYIPEDTYKTYLIKNNSY